MYNGSYWRQRPDDTVGSDPEGIVQTAYYQQSDGSYTPGLDTRQGPIEGLGMVLIQDIICVSF